ncbi:P-loop containing nucleoside triphosphate hydrolase protein [Gorgonomyces haynaldii]|nr:P-loop containing nucleoside triphosphate hydrolase protein [Gorgonomyces haynaldii]
MESPDKSHKRKKEKKQKKEKKADKDEERPSKKVKTVTKDVDSFLKEHEIQITTLDGKPFEVDPIMDFDEAEFPKKLRKALVFDKPTPIQSVTWPPILKGRDLVGIAATGSGKTLAFGIPAFIQNLDRPQSKKPQILVLSPTRELAMQIQDQFVTFGKKCGVESCCIYGGVSKKEQKDMLRAGINCIVATPGRLIDLFEEDKGLCDLSQVKYLVLDEADRMLDQGFEEAIKKIINQLPKQRQTVMFSATWPQAIQKMANSYLNDPIKITVGSTDLSANVRIEQRVEVVDPRGKETRLVELLKTYHDKKNRILIFALYKKEASRLEMFIRQKGYKVGAIHGDLSQQQRTQALEQFKSGAVPLLIATDVAARGVDIPNVEYVINVTFPLTVEDYVHRIGRTGRAGKTGISHTLFTVHDKAHSGALINVLKQANQVVPPELMKFGTTVKKKLDPNYGAFAKDVDMSVKGTKITFDDSD